MTITKVAHDGEHEGGGDRDQLDPDLARVAVDQARCTPPGSPRGEDAGREGAEDAADAVDGEDVERVVQLTRPAGAPRCSKPAGARPMIRRRRR